MEFIIAQSEADFNAAKKLFRTYAEWLQVDLCFQSFEEELNNLSAMYNQTIGGIVLCKDGVDYIGCAAIRPKPNGNCELKRMWVEDAYKGQGLGEQLLLRCIVLAQQLGYKKILLDTLITLQPAIALYKKHGFVETTAYYENPLEGVVYMELGL